MKIVLLMLPIALLLGFGFVVAFITVALSGQYDDLDTPAHRILLPETQPKVQPDTLDNER